MTINAVCVFCASSERIDPRYQELAETLAVSLASKGLTLVSGGGSVSMMGTIARTMRAHGGHTVGVIPQALIDMEVADLAADELIVTPDMRTRKAEMDSRADLFIALPGGIGTLEELTEVWTAFTLGLHAKPIVVIDPWGDYTHLHALIDHLVVTGFMRASGADALHWVSTVDEAMRLIDTHLAQHEGPVPHVDEALEG